MLKICQSVGEFVPRGKRGTTRSRIRIVIENEKSSRYNARSRLVTGGGIVQVFFIKMMMGLRNVPSESRSRPRFSNKVPPTNKVIRCYPARTHDAGGGRSRERGRASSGLCPSPPPPRPGAGILLPREIRWRSRSNRLRIGGERCASYCAGCPQYPLTGEQKIVKIDAHIAHGARILQPSARLSVTSSSSLALTDARCRQR